MNNIQNYNYSNYNYSKIKNNNHNFKGKKGPVCADLSESHKLVTKIYKEIIDSYSKLVEFLKSSQK